MLNAGVFHLDSGEDGGTDNACECLRSATEILNGYFEALGFDHSGQAPMELVDAERMIAERNKPKENHDIEPVGVQGGDGLPGGCGVGLLGYS